jgi:hypothetical protein
MHISAILERLNCGFLLTKVDPGKMSQNSLTNSYIFYALAIELTPGAL